MRTRGVGHPYTNGTADSNETWVSLDAGSGGSAASSRAACSTGTAVSTRPPTGSRRSSSTRTASPMDRRQPQDIRVPLYNNGDRARRGARGPLSGDGPGGRRGARSRCRRVRTIGSSARDYTTFSLGAAHPSLPVTTLREGQGDAAPRPRDPLSPGERGNAVTVRGNSDPLWLRWNDYGIGLFLQGDLKGAARGVDEGRRSSLPTSPTGRSTAPAPRSPRAASRTRRSRSRKPRGAGRAGARRPSSAPRSPRTRAASTTPRGTSGGPREVPARPRRVEQPRPRLLARRPVPGGDRRLRQDARDRSRRT